MIGSVPILLSLTLGGGARASPLRLLVVDDEPQICALVAEALAKSGYQVETATDDSTALASLTQHHYEAVLLDILMPRLTGEALYNWIVLHRPELEPRVGFITGDLASPATQAFLAIVPRPVLAKPFTLEALRAFVRQLVTPREED